MDFNPEEHCTPYFNFSVSEDMVALPVSVTVQGGYYLLSKGNIFVHLVHIIFNCRYVRFY